MAWSRRFDGFAALDGATLSGAGRAVYGLVGPNGAGKSTLIRHLTGIFRQDSGHGAHRRRGRVGKRRPEGPDRRHPRRLVLLQLQSSIRDMMRFYRGFYPAFSTERYEKLKEVFQSGRKAAHPAALSKGMQKQAAFWLALCCHAGLPDSG